jgi:hypothetical protein
LPKIGELGRLVALGPLVAFMPASDGRVQQIPYSAVSLLRKTLGRPSKRFLLRPVCFLLALYVSRLRSALLKGNQDWTFERQDPSALPQLRKLA